MASTRKYSVWFPLEVQWSEKMYTVSTSWSMLLSPLLDVSLTWLKRGKPNSTNATCLCSMRWTNFCQMNSRKSWNKSLESWSQTTKCCSSQRHTLWRSKTSETGSARMQKWSDSLMNLHWRDWLSTMHTWKRRRSCTVWTPCSPSWTSLRPSSSATVPRESSYWQARYLNLVTLASTFTLRWSRDTEIGKCVHSIIDKVFV